VGGGGGGAPRPWEGCNMSVCVNHESQVRSDGAEYPPVEAARHSLTRPMRGTDAHHKSNANRAGGDLQVSNLDFMYDSPTIPGKLCRNQAF